MQWLVMYCLQTPLALNAGGSAFFCFPVVPCSHSLHLVTVHLHFGVLVPQVRFCPQHVVQRKLGVSGRTLGRITGNIWVNDGDSKMDLGLAVKAHGKGLCVPGYTQAQVRRSCWLCHAMPCMAALSAAAALLDSIRLAVCLIAAEQGVETHAGLWADVPYLHRAVL
jgi:hypothetical protein